ncbi:MAG: hypothetical protein RLZZ244_248 [Verrucomicrobiota bacterium]|jgi:dihydrodipicolinate synthase/N-acetylneuraminate lyase
MKYHGIIPPLITPLLASGALDPGGLERLVEHVLGGGVHGLFLLGTTGEGPGLAYAVRRELVERACRQVAGRVPVLVCVTDPSYEQALVVARWAADAGADAVVAAPPFYWTPSQAELRDYYHQLAAQSPLPLFLYNMPGRTQTVIEPDTVRFLREHPRILGLKDSSGSMNYLHQVLTQCRNGEEWPVFVGEEETLPYALSAGAQGGVHGGANVFPRLFVRLYEACIGGQQTLAGHLQKQVIAWGAAYRLSPGPFSGIRGIKTALSLRGLCHEAPTFPYRGLDPEARESAAALVAKIEAVEHELG